ncbi:hypothetical protein SERLADRAFT_409827 [Serpula lacrymans var. lacrymans S7.9]|uniref:Uncharacterized protein n=1 Tax=Serpula lacrymans var. lacrymans (strain S7.9) TaxID=578457 RepID=F8P412_SERL9|nr:uncharacterized protein SERLADRAFT_409827 [Serpula lacrymans var. lacrymans S7.9]EGO22260.1 hypothetical protein SERLADRAFT_409827 [Serpula lacrymans var. lacrymans S7.9]
MALNISAGVPDESAWDILNDSTNLIGTTTINGVSYGIMFTLYVTCVHFLYQRFKTSGGKRTSVFLFGYMSVMFIFGTLYTVSGSRTIQLAYVNHRDYSAGPAAYDLVIFSQPITILGSVSYTVSNWMSDGLILWRFIILYQNIRYNLWIITFPCILFLASIGAAHAAQYTGIATLLIESSALYALWSIIFLVLYAINNPVQFVFLASLAEVQIIAPLLIIVRVAQGKAWTRNTESAILSTFVAKQESKATYKGNKQEDSRTNTLSVSASQDHVDHDESIHSLKFAPGLGDSNDIPLQTREVPRGMLQC